VSFAYDKSTCAAGSCVPRLELMASTSTSTSRELRSGYTADTGAPTKLLAFARQTRTLIGTLAAECN
jgi:hypothetical protein